MNYCMFISLRHVQNLMTLCLNFLLCLNKQNDDTTTSTVPINDVLRGDNLVLQQNSGLVDIRREKDGYRNTNTYNSDLPYKRKGRLLESTVKNKCWSVRQKLGKQIPVQRIFVSNYDPKSTYTKQCLTKSPFFRLFYEISFVLFPLLSSFLHASPFLFPGPGLGVFRKISCGRIFYKEGTFPPLVRYITYSH